MPGVTGGGGHKTLSIGCPVFTYIYKVGGDYMDKKEWGSSITIAVLLMVLAGIIGMTVKSMCQYYGGKEYKVDCYIQYLNQREYGKLYDLLAQSSMADLGGKADIEAYYKKIYERENKLISVEKKACNHLKYTLQYHYVSGTQLGEIQVIKEKGRYKIQFPFEKSEVQVFAPLGSKVYLESQLMPYNMDTGNYKLKGVLPGTYFLKVSFDKASYKDYFTAIHIPEDKNFEVPYDTGYVKVNCAPNLHVTLENFSKKSNGKKVEFNDLLYETYHVTVEDEDGYFKPQEQDIKVSQRENICTLRDFQLSEKGKEKLNDFIQDFYDTYIKAIASHKSNGLNAYFAGKQKAAQLELFQEWYIDKKNIEQVKMNLKVGNYYIDESGQIHIALRESAQLYNKEYDDLFEKEVLRCYKVMIDYETVINVLEADWKVTDRKILQSIVAVQDQEGRWVQY